MEKIKSDLKRLKNYSVLVVDDDPTQLAFLEGMLKHFFGTIHSAVDGQDALEKYEKYSPKVVFTDYVMPNMDGLHLAQELRSLNEELSIVILSNYSEREKLLSIIPLKVSAYLLKPVSLSVMMETLHIVLNELIKSKQLDFKINDDLTYDMMTKTLYSKEHGEITLVKNEITLLELLIDRVNSLVSNELIYDALSDEKDLSYKAIANIIYRLKKKIGKDMLLNVQSLGYMLKSSS